MNDTLQKPGAIVKMLGVSGVTVRNYSHQFSSFLSPGATSETGRHFTSEDVKVLRLAASLLRQGFSYEEVRHQLEENQPMTGEVFEEGAAPEPRQEPPPSAIAPLEFFTQFIETLKDEHQATLQAKDETIANLKEDKKRLQEEVSWLRLPFFVKWFRKPPG